MSYPVDSMSKDILKPVRSTLSASWQKLRHGGCKFRLFRHVERLVRCLQIGSVVRPYVLSGNCALLIQTE